MLTPVIKVHVKISARSHTSYSTIELLLYSYNRYTHRDILCNILRNQCWAGSRSLIGLEMDRDRVTKRGSGSGSAKDRVTNGGSGSGKGSNNRINRGSGSGSPIQEKRIGAHHFPITQCNSALNIPTSVSYCYSSLRVFKRRVLTSGRTV